MAIFDKFKATFEAKVDEILVKGAASIAEDARQNAPTARIKANIHVTPVENTPEGKKISVYVDITPNSIPGDMSSAPEGRAYEYGSGIHDPDNPGLIDIAAVNAPNLVFFWERADKMFVGPNLPIGHPGVAAKPYLGPAVRKNRRTISGLLAKGLGALIRTELTTGFRTK